ncbi:MAG: hypothetical protein GY777_18765 [Candidatus Brocadiaceae bacterium]|nr:hypothetical protein [Candidatus Brocadiaceae bacterium]
MSGPKEGKLLGQGLPFSHESPVSRYNAVLDIKKEDIGLENTYSWDVNSVFSNG